MKNSITAQQSRDARRELGLSQADITNALGFTRQYISEFETGFSTRLTNAQLKKLRTFYEDKIKAANESGEDIALSFDAPETDKPASRIETYTSKRITFPVDDNVSDATFAATLDTIHNNDKTLVTLLNSVADRSDAMFGAGDLNENTLTNLRECFTLLSANYLMLRSITGWPQLGLSASNENLSSNTVLALMMNEVKASFEKAGLVSDKSDEAENEGAQHE
jgi:transcriptional regulator with XRE-family HTH domain